MPQGSEPPAEGPPQAPPPPAEGGGRPLGALGVAAAMLLVPAGILGLVLAYVPRLRPWAAESPAGSASAAVAAEAPVPEGKVQLAGRVVDGEGEPVEGARVVVLARGTRLEEQTTGRGGIYGFTLDPGRFILVAEHDKGIVASAELMLAQGAVMKNLVLTLGALRTLRGMIRGEDGAVVAGAQVRVDGPGWLARSGQSEADGSYRIARMPAEVEAQLRVVAQGYAAASVKLRSTTDSGDEVHDFKLLREADVDGLVLGPDNQPAQASVQACDGKEPGQKVVSGADGKFKMAREFARCPLVAYHDAFASSEPVLPENGSVQLRLRAGGSIAGVVVDEAGGAVPSFFVGVESFVPSFGDRTHSVRSGTAKNFDDKGGAFLLERLAPGSYVLSVGTDGRSPVRSSPIDVVAGQTTPQVRIVLLRGGTVEGQVFDDEKRTPIAGARVEFNITTMTNRESVPPAQSDDSGRFRLEGAPVGPFSLQIRHEGYRSRIIAGLRVANGQVLKQDVALRPGDGSEFVGIGATLNQSRDGVVFQTVFDGSPAAQAGLQPGDLLRRIDGQSIDGLSVADAIQRLRGEKKSLVRVGIERPPSGQQLELSIVRDEIVR